MHQGCFDCLKADSDESDEHGKKCKWVIYLSVIGNIAIYSYGGTYGMNCVYDNSNPKVYPTKVISKSIGSGKHTSYYLKVDP